MAKCTDCGRDMRTAPGCTRQTIEIGGELVPRLRHRRFRGEPPGRCGDCGAEVGQLHHLGCDMESCPRCGGQLFLCGCRGDPEDEEVDEVDDDWWPPSQPTHLRLV